MMYRFFIFSILVVTTFALDCTQIPSSQILDGNTVFIPGPSNNLQTIPANFYCTYTISAPYSSTKGLYANVLVKNGLKGVNDFILVTDLTGAQTTITNRSVTTNNTFQYFVIPGSSMSIQVVTKSVFMSSQFSVTLEYHDAKSGPIFQMKTGGDMNFLDVSSLRDNSSLYNAFTYTGTEPIQLTIAINDDNISQRFCYVIDGTLENPLSIGLLRNVGNLQATSNSITVVTFSNDDLSFVFNTVAETKPFSSLLGARALQNPRRDFLSSYGFLRPEALQVVNFDSVGIVIDQLNVMSDPCKAYIVSGPPNNSSKILLNISKNLPMPQTFNLQYFTIIEEDCAFEVFFRSS
ncbi:unnamed protein product [Caenorhabditis nigoni]